ncbi:MAG: arsenate reductase ArsC [Desulfobulbaceae bacterium]|nr:arsenate reductase ArsC [Desulfobulbaceae bacterium]HIJ78780.1 arsenate reductase ArsC [Deltaproteobacteria bacterium]
MTAKPKILFLCTGNSCRSQMAEGWANHLLGDRITACSAGIEVHGLNPLAVKVMAEAGVDISGHQSKLISDLPDLDFDLIVTVCDHAAEQCPLFCGKGAIIHHSFPDPPRLAAKATTEAEALTAYRLVRDEIKTFVADKLPTILRTKKNTQNPAVSIKTIA